MLYKNTKKMQTNFSQAFERSVPPKKKKHALIREMYRPYVFVKT